MAELRKISKGELREVLRKHELWLERKEGGERADLEEANLKRANLVGANLEGANLKRANFEGANLKWANLKRANLKWANLKRANLEWANLKGTDFEEANLEEANLDFSCLPLWCGSLNADFDDRQIIQIVYHAVKAGTQSKNTSEEVKKELYKLIELANSFHRVKECGWIDHPEKDEAEGENKK